MQHLFKYCLSVILLLCSSTEILGQQAVRVQREDKNVVPVVMYPANTERCLGIALISPGAGGSENGYGYLAKHMSGLGYLAAVIGHQESGRQALRKNIMGHGLRGGLEALITDPEAYLSRQMDIHSTRRYTRLQCTGKETILLGHSMGAATVMMLAGAQNKMGIQSRDAFDLFVALSPQGTGSIFPENAWRTIERPVLSITGTKDNELGAGSWESRAEPFDNMPNGCKWLGVIDNASHMNFAGRGLSGSAEKLTVKLIQSFIEAVHQGDCKAPASQNGLSLRTK